MSREQHHTLHHINVHLANVKPSQHLVQSQLDRNTSRRFQSVNLTLNPAILSHKTQLEYEDARRRHGDTLEVTREHEIYFNRAKKYNYMKEIIDKYFQENKKERQNIKGINPEASIHKNLRTLIPKIHRQKQKEEKEEEGRSENHEEKQKVRISLLNKRKNKIVMQKEDQQELRSSIETGKGNAEKEEGLSKALSFCSTKAINLPPIDEMFEDKDDELHDFQYQSISIINQSSMDHAKEDKIMIQDNQIYFVEAVSINGKIHHHIKTFKEKGQEILKREIRATSLGVESIWIEYRYDPRSLVSPPCKSLKEMLFKAKRQDQQAKFYTLKPKKLYKRLVTNDCEELIRLVREFCEFMKKFEGKILNNKINTSNLFIGKSENLRIGEWGFASFKETHLIQNMEFQNRIEPIVKSQKEWFVPPQYLAPEILKAIVLGEDVDLMSFGSSPDIWSFGVALLEILTLVPVWIQQKCNIYGKSTAPRCGLLSIGDRDLKKLLKREQKLVYLVTKLLQQQFSEERFNSKLINVILRCIQFQPQDRPSFQQIIQSLK